MTAALHRIDEDYVASAFAGTELASWLLDLVYDAPPSLGPPPSRQPVRIDGAYVVDETRVDAFADRSPQASLAVLLPAWRWDEVPWRSLVE
jgi:hypothetical protein